MKDKTAVTIAAVNILKLQAAFRFSAASVRPDDTAWLRRYFRAHAPSVIGDDAATTFLSCAAVITTAVTLGTDSDQLLTDVTRYPAPFVTAVCRRMKLHGLWDHPEVVNLQHLTRHHRQDFARISKQVQAVGDAFWDANWTPETEFALEALRQRILFGGASQYWVDTGALSFFGLLEYQSPDIAAKA